MSKVLQSISVYALTNVIGQLFSFGLVAVYTTILSPKDFGLLSTIEVAIFLCNTFVLLALDRAAQRYYYDDEPDYPNYVMNTVFWLILGWSVFLLAGLFVVEYLIGFDRPWLSQVNVFTWAILISFGYAMNSMTLIYCQIHGKPKVYLYFTLCKLASLALFTWYFLYHKQLGVPGYLFAQASTYGVLTIFTVRLIQVRFVGFLSLALIKPLFAFSLPFVPTLISAWLMGMANRFFLEHYASLEDVALFSLAYKMSTAYFIATAAIAITVGPITFEAYKKEKKMTPELAHLLSRINAVLIVSAILLGVLAEPALSWFFDETYQDAFQYISPLLLTHYLSAFMGVTTNLSLSFFKKTMLQMWFFMASALVCVALNQLLVPEMGIKGTIIASICSTTFLFCLHGGAMKLLTLPHFSMVSAWIGVCVIGLSFLINFQIKNASWQGVYPQVALLALFLIFFAARQWKNTKNE